jgi:Fur family ferric uptake transcriptional regulator
MTADSSIHDEVAVLLRRADQHYTTGRRRLVDALLAGGGPMTIAQILAKSDRLAQSSVYRNLVVLEQVGAVTRIITRDDFARYELTERLTDDHHHHLVCTSCGDVRDFSFTDETELRLDNALRRVAKRAGFTVQAHRLDLVGTCASCD